MIADDDDEEDEGPRGMMADNDGEEEDERRGTMSKDGDEGDEEEEDGRPRKVARHRRARRMAVNERMVTLKVKVQTYYATWRAST